MLEHRNDLRKKCVVNIGHRDGDGVGLIGPQAGGVEISAIAEFARRDIHPLRQILSDGPTAIEDVRDGADRHARELRDVVDRRLLGKLNACGTIYGRDIIDHWMRHASIRKSARTCIFLPHETIHQS